MPCTIRHVRAARSRRGKATRVRTEKPGGASLLVHLDTNVLIAIATGDARPLAPLLAKLSNGAKAETSTLAWFEFLCGSPGFPLTEEEIERPYAVIEGRVIEDDQTVAAVAARLFNQAGRRKGSQIDCVIAACAITHDAALYSLNQSDFQRFEAFGLRLMHE